MRNTTAERTTRMRLRQRARYLDDGGYIAELSRLYCEEKCLNPRTILKLPWLSLTKFHVQCGSPPNFSHFVAELLRCPYVVIDRTGDSPLIRLTVKRTKPEDVSEVLGRRLLRIAKTRRTIADKTARAAAKAGGGTNG
jgi:hypothetical protein